MTVFVHRMGRRVRGLKTLIELYDNEAIENILAPIAIHPERVIYLWDESVNGMVDGNREGGIRRFLNGQKPVSSAIFYEIESAELADIRKELEAILGRYEDCVIDFTGGSGILFFAVSMYASEHHVPSFFIDFSSKKMVNLFGCEELAREFKMPPLTSKELFRITGGSVYRYGNFEDKWKEETFQQEVKTVWELYFQSPDLWNAQMEYIEYIDGHYGNPSSSLAITAPCMINAYKKMYRNNETLLDEWRKIGILQYTRTQQNMLHILFKDESIKRCVTNMKSSLLLYLYSTACSANVFDEVRISLMVDSDEISRQYHNAASKIDLLLMKDIVPVFVKCTVNAPTRQDLEGLYMQARKFGGRLSKMVIVTLKDVRYAHPATAESARSLGIEILDRFDHPQRNLLKELCWIASQNG